MRTTHFSMTLVSFKAAVPAPYLFMHDSDFNFPSAHALTTSRLKTKPEHVGLPSDSCCTALGHSEKPARPLRQSNSPTNPAQAHGLFHFDRYW